MMPVPLSVHPGHNRVELHGQAGIPVRIHLTDRGREVPWNWEWNLHAVRADGNARSTRRALGELLFRDAGVYQLFAPGGMSGFEPIDGTTLVVRPLASGEDYLEVEVPLQRSEG